MNNKKYNDKLNEQIKNMFYELIINCNTNLIKYSDKEISEITYRYVYEEDLIVDFIIKFINNEIIFQIKNNDSDNVFELKNNNYFNVVNSIENINVNNFRIEKIINNFMINWASNLLDEQETIWNRAIVNNDLEYSLEFENGMKIVVVDTYDLGRLINFKFKDKTIICDEIEEISKLNHFKLLDELI